MGSHGSGPQPDSEVSDEIAWVRRAREGDDEAWNWLIERHHGTVFRFVLSILKDEDQAADATQETFLKAIRRIERFRGESSLRTWLLAIARNEALGSIRTRGRRRERPIEPADAPLIADDRVEDAVFQAAEVERVRAALDRLPEKQRLSVSLRLFDGLSFRDVGAATGSSEGAARVNYHYGVARLRELLDESNS